MTATAQPKKAWFHINEDVEYSTDFTFFCQHQVRLVKSGYRYNFCSRLEGKTFRIEKAIFRDNEFSDKELTDKWKEIHSEILAGKHHTNGKFVD